MRLKPFLHLNRIASGMVNVQFLLDGRCFSRNGQNIVSLIQINLSFLITGYVSQKNTTKILKIQHNSVAFSKIGGLYSKPIILEVIWRSKMKIKALGRYYVTGSSDAYSVDRCKRI